MDAPFLASNMLSSFEYRTIDADRTQRELGLNQIVNQSAILDHSYTFYNTRTPLPDLRLQSVKESFTAEDLQNQQGESTIQELGNSVLTYYRSDMFQNEESNLQSVGNQYNEGAGEILQEIGIPANGNMTINFYGTGMSDWYQNGDQQLQPFGIGFPEYSATPESQAEVQKMKNKKRKINTSTKTISPGRGNGSGRAKKQAVLDEAKDEEYWSKRMKNNESTKRCRESQKSKINEIVTSNSDMEKSIKDLEELIRKVEKNCKILKQQKQIFQKTLSDIGNLCKAATSTSTST